MNNVEVEQITDKYAYMNAKTFKEFLKLYPLSSTYEWAGMLLKWLVFTYVDDFETFRHFVLLPHRLAWNNGEIDIYEDNSVLDWISWYWFEDDIVEPLFADRSDMTEDDKQQWEESYYNITWVVWRVVDNGKTAGEEIIDAIYSKQCILIAILDWTEKNADKLQ